MINYKRLNDLEREEISRMLSQKFFLNEIAKALRRHTSTISREISLGSCNKYTYRASKAQNKAEKNASKRESGKYRLNDNLGLWSYIRKKLKKKWLPRQIAEELEIDYPEDMTMCIAPETIYTYIYVLLRGTIKKELTVCLRRNHKRGYKQSREVKIERKLENCFLGKCDNFRKQPLF